MVDIRILAVSRAHLGLTSGFLRSGVILGLCGGVRLRFLDFVFGVALGYVSQKLEELELFPLGLWLLGFGG